MGFQEASVFHSRHQTVFHNEHLNNLEIKLLPYLAGFFESNQI